MLSYIFTFLIVVPILSLVALFMTDNARFQEILASVSAIGTFLVLYVLSALVALKPGLVFIGWFVAISLVISFMGYHMISSRNRAITKTEAKSKAKASITDFIEL